MQPTSYCLFFFFNDTATTEIYTLSLHDALPIYTLPAETVAFAIQEISIREMSIGMILEWKFPGWRKRSEEHTSELQSPDHLVCRLLLEKKKKHITHYTCICQQRN